MTIQEIITDEQINTAWGNASFGKDVLKRDVIANALLKYASEYGTGYTIEQICRELGLITKQCKLNTRGRQYLYEYYRNGLSV
jgi:hypothetical protein